MESQSQIKTTETHKKCRYFFLDEYEKRNIGRCLPSLPRYFPPMSVKTGHMTEAPEKHRTS